MIKAMWKKAYSKQVLIAVIMVLAGVAVFLFLHYEHTMVAEREYTPISEINPANVSDQYVTIQYSYVAGNISEKGKYQLDGEIRYSEGFKNRMNIVLTDGLENHPDWNKRGAYFIVVEIPKNMEAQSDTVESNSAELSAAWEEGKVLSARKIEECTKGGFEIKGRIRPMSKLMSMRYEAFFRDRGYNYKDYAQYCLPYYIEVVKDKPLDTGVVRLLSILGGLCILCGAGLLVDAIFMFRLRPLLNRLEAIDPDEQERAENDFIHARSMDGDIFIGDKFLFSLSQREAISFTRLLWIFPYAAGLNDPFEKEKEIIVKKNSVFFCDDKGNIRKIAVKSIESAKSLIESILSKCSGAKNGYSDETKKRYEFHRPDLIKEREEARKERTRLLGGRKSNSAPAQDFSQYRKELEKTHQEESDKPKENLYSPIVKKEQIGYNEREISLRGGAEIPTGGEAADADESASANEKSLDAEPVESGTNS